MFTVTNLDPATKRFESRNFEYLDEASEFIAYLMDFVGCTYYSLTYLKAA